MKRKGREEEIEKKKTGKGRVGKSVKIRKRKRGRKTERVQDMEKNDEDERKTRRE